MSGRKYGTLEYERASAITFVEAVVLNGGLCQGGEQHPNALCAIDHAQSLKRAVSKETDIPDEERDACLDLVKGLEDVWDKGMADERDGGVTLDRLTELADAAMVAGVPAWAP